MKLQLPIVRSSPHSTPVDRAVHTPIQVSREYWSVLTVHGRWPGVNTTQPPFHPELYEGPQNVR